MPTLNFNVQKARQDGVTDEEIQQYVASEKAKGNTINLQGMESEQPKNESGIRDMIINSLPVVGAIGGSFIPGLGNIVGGAVGAGAGALAKNLLDDKKGVDAGEIVKETALGGVGGVIAKGAGSLATKMLPKITGKALEKSGEVVAMKGLRLRPTQLAKFQERWGEDVFKVLERNNVVGGSADDIAETAIKPLQESFSQIARQSGIKVSKGDIQAKYLEKIQKLLDAGTGDDERLAIKLLEEADIVTRRMDDVVDIGRVTELNRNYSSKVKDWNDLINSGKNELSSDVFREVAQEAADGAGVIGVGGKNLKELGLELGKLRTIERTARMQENLGRGSLPIGLTQLLGITAGGVGGGIPGAITGMGAVALANNPTAMRIYSQLSRSAGGALKNGFPQATNLTQKGLFITGQGARLPNAQQLPPIGGDMYNNQENNNTQNNQSNNSHSLPTISQGITESNSQLKTRSDGYLEDINGRIFSEDKQWVWNQTANKWDQNPEAGSSAYSPEALKQIYIQALQAGDTKTMKRIEDAYKFLFTEGKAKDKTIKQTQLQAAADGARQALMLLESGGVNVGPIAGRVEGLKSATIGTNATQQDFMGTVAIARSALLNAYLGGNIPPSEYERISAGIPTANDPLSTAKQKLVTFVREVERVSNAEATPDTITPDASMPSMSY